LRYPRHSENYTALPSSRLEVPLRLSLRRHPDAWLGASAFLTAKGDVAEEAVPSDARTLKQEREGVLTDPPATTRQAQKRVALAHRFPNGSRAPPGIEFHDGEDCTRKDGTEDITGEKNKKPSDSTQRTEGFRLHLPTGTGGKGGWGRSGLACSGYGEPLKRLPPPPRAAACPGSNSARG